MDLAFEKNYREEYEKEKKARIRAEKKLEYKETELENLKYRLEVVKRVLKKPLPTNKKKSDTEMRDFAYVVAHDLKSPLKSINTLIYWLNKDHVDSFNEESLKIINEISKKAFTMHALIDGILEYSSIDNRSEEKQPIDLNKTIKDIRRIIDKPKNIKIICKNKLPTINGNKYRIQQVFQNLIVNSIAYMDKPEGVIAVDFTEKENYWEFSVEDNGMGIDKENFDRIFKAFQSLNSKDKTTGLGLSIVKKIVSHYQGRIWLESEVDKGTCFYFTLKK